MARARLTPFEFQILNILWEQREASIRKIQEAFSEKKRPAYTTVQTMVYRLENKSFVRRVRKEGNFHIFEPVVSYGAAQRRLIDDLVALFGGRVQPVVSHLVESGKLKMEDIKQAEKALRKLSKTERRS